MDTTYLQFCPKLKRMIETGKALDKNGEEVEISGVSTLGNIRAIRELILRERCTHTLEIGLAFGGSALTFLSTLRESSTGAYHHTAIDPFQSKAWRGTSLRAISDEGFMDHFTLHEDYSSLVLPDLVRKKTLFDLIYIDGSHLFEDVFLDFFYCTRLLKNGGIMLLDDCRDRHVLKVIKFIRTNYSQFLSELDYSIVDDPKKELKKKIGNRLGVRQLCGFKKVGEPPRSWNASFSNF